MGLCIQISIFFNPKKTVKLPKCLKQKCDKTILFFIVYLTRCGMEKLECVSPCQWYVREITESCSNVVEIEMRKKERLRKYFQIQIYLYISFLIPLLQLFHQHILLNIYFSYVKYFFLVLQLSEAHN